MVEFPSRYRTPDFQCAAPAMAACAAFFKESRMKFANANQPRQEMRGSAVEGVRRGKAVLFSGR
jgi:hypothetical protein